MGPKGGSGKPADFAGSMAEAMEEALNKLLKNETPSMNRFEVNTNSQEARDRRRLFVAIAQGIVRHLKDNADALWIENSLNVKLPMHIDPQTDGTLL
jgi:hypothetical protein